MPDADVLPALSPRRAKLAGFDHAYAVALQVRRQSGIRQFIVSTGNPLQPYRTTGVMPGNDETLLALVA